MSRNQVDNSRDSLNFRAFILSDISVLLSVLAMISIDFKVSKTPGYNHENKCTIHFPECSLPSTVS